MTTKENNDMASSAWFMIQFFIWDQMLVWFVDVGVVFQSAGFLCKVDRGGDKARAGYERQEQKMDGATIGEEAKG